MSLPKFLEPAELQTFYISQSCHKMSLRRSLTALIQGANAGTIPRSPGARGDADGLVIIGIHPGGLSFHARLCGAIRWIMRLGLARKLINLRLSRVTPRRSGSGQQVRITRALGYACSAKLDKIVPQLWTKLERK